MASKEKKSKKQSDTKLPPEKLLEDIVFFVDRSLGKHTVPQALRDRRLNIEIHADHFHDQAPDPEWLTACGQKKWVALTKDERIRRNELERAALFNAGIASFILVSGDLSGQGMADAIIKALAKMAQLLKNQKRPFIAKINKNGEVKLWIDAKGKNRLKD